MDAAKQTKLAPLGNEFVTFETKLQPASNKRDSLQVNCPALYLLRDYGHSQFIGGDSFMGLKFIKLTSSRIRALKPNQKIQEHGIELHRLLNGDGRFSINIRVNGIRIHRVIGRESEGVTLTQVEEILQKLKTEARENRLNLPKGRKLHMRFEEVADKYLERMENTDCRSIEMKRQQIRDYLKPFFKGQPISQISTFDLERYKRHRKEVDAANATINRELALLSHIFNRSVEWGWLDKVPCKTKKLKEENARIAYLTKEQAGRLLKEARNDSNPYIYLFIFIGLETAMRRMEILSIQLENIDLSRQIIYIPQAKAGAREQPINKRLATFLREYIAYNVPVDQPWLFPATKSKLGHTVAIEKPFRRVVKAIGLDPGEIVRHSLRHTAITYLVQAGVDLPTVQRISGHKTLQMVVRYSHQNGTHIKQAMEKLEKKYRIKS